jgi:hypothetical protein
VQYTEAPICEGCSGVSERQSWQHVRVSPCPHRLLATATDRWHSASATDPDQSNASPIKCATPDKQSAHDRSPTPRSAIASLRQNLSRHSRHSGRGSVSNVFRRSVDASSLRSAHDLEIIVHNSQNTRKTASPLAKDGNKNRDPATLVPLPSSPIDIPVPLPVLRVDLGPPAMLSPFQITHSDLAEIRVLQDPTNITTGVPTTCPLDWTDRHVPFRAQPEAVTARSELPNIGRQHVSVQLQPSIPPQVSTGVHNDIFGHPSPDLTCDSPPRSRKSNIALIYEHCPPGSALRETDRDDPFQVPCSVTRVLHPSIDASNRVDGTAKHQSLECTETTACSAPQTSHSMARAVMPPTHSDTFATCKDLLDDAIDDLQLPSPVVALRIPSPQHTSVPEQPDHETSKDSPSEIEILPVDTEVTRAQKKYRDSLAALEGLELEELESEVTRHVEENPFVGAPGTPAPAFSSSDSVVSIVHPSPPGENFDAIEIPERTAEHFQESKENRRDSLVDDGKYEIVYQHGPPSPERCVRLPLRPKSILTKHNSFESALFKPILDRVAAKHLGVFRPGSDSSLRQKYFPHSAASPCNPARYPRQPSLDLDDIESVDTESCDDVGLFERAIERPSPLRIHKQSHNTPVHAVSSPQTPASTSTLQAPGSSPTRTPSMGDRRLFDLQRAERDARYNAIHAGVSPNTVLKDTPDILLAEFGNAGPGSKGSTPTRSSGGRGGQRRMSPTYLQRLMGQDPNHTPSPKFGISSFRAL